VPISFTVTDIQPAPNNFAGATVSNPPSWNEHSGTGPVGSSLTKAQPTGWIY